jgi:hypothetical protein
LASYVDDSLDVHFGPKHSTRSTATSFNLRVIIILHSLRSTTCLLLLFPTSIMTAKAKSDTKKAQIARDAYESLKLQAIEVYRCELKKIKGKGARTVAKDFVELFKQETGKDVKLSYATLIRGAQGRRSRAEPNAARSWLKEGETKVIIEYIAELGNRGFPLSHRRLREHVNEILRARLGDKFPQLGVGKQWSNRFIEKYSDSIKMSWSTPLESKRGRAVNPHTARAWFSLLEKTVTDYKVEEECTYGTDEVGCNPAEGQKERVMEGWKSGPQYQQRDGDRENITVIVTVCADGTSTPPAVIFKGQGFQVKWKQNNPANAA